MNNKFIDIKQCFTYIQQWSANQLLLMFQIRFTCIGWAIGIVSTLGFMYQTPSSIKEQGKSLFPNTNTTLIYDYTINNDVAKITMLYTPKGTSTMVKVNIKKDAEINPFDYYFKYDLNNETSKAELSALSTLPFYKLSFSDKTVFTPLNDNKMQYARNLTIGQTLPDVAFSYQVSSEIGKFFVFEGTTNNIKVNQQQTVTYKNITYTSYQINYTLDFSYSFDDRLIERIQTHVTEWFVPDLGIVKRISINTPIPPLTLIDQKTREVPKNQATETFSLEGLAIQ